MKNENIDYYKKLIKELIETNNSDCCFYKEI